MVWDGGPCFLNGRPFVFQKWSWDFRPSKEAITEIPIWIKLRNFPLCCWNETGLSKVASWVGVPLAVDSLTAAKARITFARICVQISTSSKLPDSVPINLNGKKFIQPIIYDWKPTVCSSCNSFSHDTQKCPQNTHIPSRGRSRSKAPKDSTNVASQKEFPSTSNPLPPSLQIPSNNPPAEEPNSNFTQMTDSSKPPTPSKAITNLNQLPIHSPLQEEDQEMEDTLLVSKELASNDNSKSYQEQNTVGVITRSAAASPNKYSNLQTNQKGPRPPGNIFLDNGASTSTTHTYPTPQTGHRKKGKKLSSSSSQ